MKTTLHMLATLIVVGMLSGAGLSLMNGWADPLIAENQRKVRDAAIGFLVPGRLAAAGGRQPSLTAWRVVGDDGALKGWVVRASGIGFQAEIDLMIALDPDRQEIRGPEGAAGQRDARTRDLDPPRSGPAGGAGGLGHARPRRRGERAPRTSRCSSSATGAASICRPRATSR